MTNFQLLCNILDKMYTYGGYVVITASIIATMVMLSLATIEVIS